jgi:hypothetical protein
LLAPPFAPGQPAITLPFAERFRCSALRAQPDSSRILHASPIAVVADQPSVSRNRLVLVVYTAAIFVSALLLFSVQPLFTKMVLPRLGGSPAVWSVAMVFFQSLLLGGYAYAPLPDANPQPRDSGGGASRAARRRIPDPAAVDC